ncbi:MAG: dihydroneopterin aldolase [Flavobacteriaceae bacterium]|jgi:dihydroneopterin aldolase
MGKVILNDVRIYAFHGCMEEEKRIGSDYLVRLEVETNMSVAAESDQLEDAVDYVALNAIIRKEMSIRSKLLEHVGQRIINNVLSSFPEVNIAEVTVSKQNPPIGGDVKEVSIHLKGKR